MDFLLEGLSIVACIFKVSLTVLYHIPLCFLKEVTNSYDVS